MGKEIIPGQSIHIAKQGKGVTLSKSGVKIEHKGQGIKPGFVQGVVYMLVDCSYSMDGIKLSQAKKGALGFAREAQSKGYNVALIKFSDDAILLLDPSPDISELSAAIDRLITDGTTNMSDAIGLAMKKMENMKESRVMMIVTDGMPDDTEAALREAKQAKEKGIDIMAIGTDDADVNFIKKIATRTELGIKVDIDRLEIGITSTAENLPLLGSGSNKITKPKSE